MDPDPHKDFELNPDPHQNNTDPPPSPLKVAGRHGAFIWRILVHHVESPPEKHANWLGGGGGGTLCIWLGLAHFHKGYSFLMISPNLLGVWPVFFLILSRYETAHFFDITVFRTSGDGYSLLGSKK
jgi:hypothetical protein